MSRVIEVFIGQGDNRRLVRADLVRANARTVWVRLPDGNVVKRKVQRDLPQPNFYEASYGRFAS